MPSAAVQALPWRVYAASAIGVGHLRDGQPNEDAVAHQLTLPRGGSALLVAAVADGHGDARHFRSDRGAQMAVAAGIAATAGWSANISGSPAEIRLNAQRDLVPGIVARWDKAVAADLAEHRFTVAEGAILAGLALPPATAYGSTLLVGAFTDDYAVFAQIGDGNIVAVLPDGRSASPVPHDSRLDGTHTTSLCQAGAAADFRIGVIQLSAQPLLAALLATDGFGNAQAEDRWQPGVAADLAKFALDHDPDWFATQIPDWAAQCASSAGSGDDTTIALVMNSALGSSRRPLPAEPERPAATVPVKPAQPDAPAQPEAPAPPDAPAQPDAPALPGGPARPRVRALAWILIAVCLIAAGLVLALLLSAHGRRPVVPARRSSPSPSVSASVSPSPASSTPSAVKSGHASAKAGGKGAGHG